MADILLNKDEFLIKNNYTPKKIPFLYNGANKPKLVYISDSELPADWKFNQENDNEGEYEIQEGAVDDWGNQLQKGDFTGDYILATDVEISETVDKTASQDTGYIGDWDVLHVEESGNNLSVTEFNGFDEISKVEKRIYQPELYQWETVSVEKQADGSLEVSHPTSIHTISNGKVIVEPCDRTWTNGIKLAINYDYAYLQNSTYDIDVFGGDKEEIRGLYKILDSAKENNDRVWYNVSAQRAIYYNDSENTWKLVRYNNLDLTNKTINFTSDTYSYQYVSPVDLEWLFGVTKSSTPKYSENSDTNKYISFKFPKAGSVVNRNNIVESTPVGIWESGKVVKKDENSTELTVENTIYRELSKNLIDYAGSWSNGIGVLEEEFEVEGSDPENPEKQIKLIVSGFYEEDVNGEYFLFDPQQSDTGRVWIRYGNKSTYTISYDTYWRLCTTVDGVYVLQSETVENELYKIWVCSHGNVSNYIFFSRCDNKWCIKSCENLHLDFSAVGNPSSPLVGSGTVWKSILKDDTDKEYYLKYDSRTLVWRFYDSYDNIISVQKLLPTFWTNNAIVSWSENKVVTDDELSSGIYDTEDFDEELAAYSYKKESTLKSCYLVYDFNTFTWKLIEKINLNGIYSAANSAIAEKIWKLNNSDDTYYISWNDEINRWELKSFLNALYDSTKTVPQTTPEPIEAIWEGITAVFDNSGNLVIDSGETNDANGSYSLEDKNSIGIQRVWSRTGEDGKYSVVYDSVNEKWSLRFFDTFVNGTYTVDDANASGSLKTWSKTANDCDYKIAWNNAILQWNLLKNGTKILAYSNVSSSAENTWTSGATVWKDENGVMYVSGNSETPDANGAYIDDDATKTGLRKTYSKSDSTSVYTIKYNTMELKWVIDYRNLDFNGEYHLQSTSATGNNRVYLHTGVKDNYFIKFNSVQGYWELTTDDNVLISYQDISNSDPWLGHWSLGTVSDPFAGTGFYSALVPYTVKSKQQYNYTVSGNNNSNYQIFNSIYEIQDYTKTGIERVWRSNTGMYIKFLGTRWIITDNPNLETPPENWTNSYNSIYAYSEVGKEMAQNLSKINWSTHSRYFSGTFKISSSEVEEFGSKTLWMAVGDYEETTQGSTVVRAYSTSNIVRFLITVKSNEITNVSMNLVGSTGSKYFTGFYKDPEGRFTPTDLVHATFSAASPIPIRIQFTGGFTIPGVDFTVPYTKAGIEMKTGILTQTTLGGTDSTFNIRMTVQDQAGNTKEVAQSITHIARLWRLIGTNIKADDASYQTKLFSVLSAAQSLEIPKSNTSNEDFTRQWEDIFYPTTHGYPLNADGTMNVEEAIRISKDLDETGINGPTTEELARYDQLQLTNDKTALSVDSDNRSMTSGWQKNKVYSRMESSSYGESGENLRYWIIDNTGYSDLKLEFEYFDLNNQISNIPPNILSPYDGDVLVVYDAQAEGCLEEVVDLYGKKTYKIKDSSLLVELFAFTGSCYTEDIKMKSGTALPITQTGNGFTTSPITSTSKICLILYSDNDYQGSGFKIKAGPRHSVVHYNYDMNNITGEAWVHQEPGTSRNQWYSPSKMSSSHQYLTANVTFDYENGILTLDNRSGATITGDLTVYNYLTTAGIANAPTTYFGYTNPVTGEESHPALKKFLLYNDDCVDYYEITICVKPTGIIPDYSNIYSFQNGVKNFGKIVSDYESNKDKGTITFSSSVPLGRIFGNYTYHSFYRLTNDGYGDLYFYDNALVPSADYSTTGLKDWTYVDLMIYNEGSNSLSEGIMKFMSRGYVEGSGNSQTITQVVDENRPWDVQSGTIAETVNRTGASFNVSYTGLSAKTRAAAVNAINNTSSGGVSFGSTMLPRAKAYIRLYWCLATNDSNNPSYIVTTRGKKLWSSELSGKYFVVTV